MRVLEQLRLPDVEGALLPLPFSGGCVSPDYQAFPKPRATGRLSTQSLGILKSRQLFLWFTAEPRLKWRNQQLQLKPLIQIVLKKINNN